MKTDLRKNDRNNPGKTVRNNRMGSFHNAHASKAALLIAMVFLSLTRSYGQFTTTLSTPTPVSTASMCPGTSGEILYEFTLMASGGTLLTPATHFTGMSISQTGSATSGDVVLYQLWADAPGGTLVATSTSTTFSGFNITLNGLTGTTINYWITADISPAAGTGHTIIVSPMTTANFTTTIGLRTTFGTIATGGAQTVLQAPTNITGPTAVCVIATTTLANGITGGTWTSGNTSLATIDPVTGTVTGVNEGIPTITYQLPTGCLTTTPINVNQLPVLYTVTGGGSYCAGGPGVPVGLTQSDIGVYYQLYNSAATIGDPEGNGGPLDFGAQTAPGIYTVTATDMTTTCTRNMAGSATVIVNPLPAGYLMTGGGSYCAGTTGMHIGLNNSVAGINYRLYYGSSPVGVSLAGTGAPLDFGTYTGTGSYTVLATNVTTGCTNTMEGSSTVIVNALPNAYSVFGGGSYCSGGTGVHIRLTASQIGVIYILYKDGVTVGSPVAGTGGLLLDLGLQTGAGIYTVVAMNATTFCTRNMTGSASVSINSLPDIYSVTGGGSYCAGGTGLHVGLTSSVPGISYLLYRDTTLVGSPVSGTGSALDFGAQTNAGAYTIIGVNSLTTCMNEMAGTAGIIVNPVPTPYTVTGGGTYCFGTGGLHVGLSASNTGISYQLYNSATPIGSPVAGTGYTLDFGLETPEGIYTAYAINNITMCVNDMAGSTDINVNPLPNIHTVVGGGAYCEGGSGFPVSLNGSDEGMIYLLYNSSAAVGSPLAGTGGAIDFGVQYAAGNYNIVAINSATLCTRHMADSAVIIVNPLLLPSVGIFTGSNDTACQGRLTTFSIMSHNGGTSPVFQWKINETIVSSAITLSYVPSDGDIVSLKMTSSEVCASPTSANSYDTMTVIPAITPIVSISANPGTAISSGQPVTFTANITNGGSAPICQWYINGSLVAGATSAIYTASFLFNNDSVSCSVIRNDACGMSISTYVKMTVSGLGISETTGNSSTITVIPNPNTGAFNIKGKLATTENTNVSIELTNMIGQLVYKKNTTTMNGVINEQVMVDNIAAGMYILNIRTTSESEMLHISVE